MHTAFHLPCRARTNATRPTGVLKSDFMPLTAAFDRAVQDLEALRVALPDGSQVPAGVTVVYGDFRP